MTAWLVSIGAVTLTIIALVVLTTTVFVTWMVIKAHKNRISAGKEDLVGRTAIVDIALEPRGMVLVEGERWSALSDTGNIEPEEEVIITKVEGLKLRVTKK